MTNYHSILSTSSAESLNDVCSPLFTSTVEILNKNYSALTEEKDSIQNVMRTVSINLNLYAHELTDEQYFNMYVRNEERFEKTKELSTKIAEVRGALEDSCELIKISGIGNIADCSNEYVFITSYSTRIMYEELSGTLSDFCAEDPAAL